MRLEDSDANTGSGASPGSPISDILDKTFLYGHGVGAAEDIAPEDKEKAFINTRKYALTEGEQAILQVIAEAIGDWTIDTDDGGDYISFPDGTKDYDVTNFLIRNWVQLRSKLGITGDTE